ncbi:MAG: hypothetical protein LIO86_02675 [Lachnospiraceae bacterium]|nr:hypothetical protein [Lachnospiraceae bacterium]
MDKRLTDLYHAGMTGKVKHAIQIIFTELPVLALIVDEDTVFGAKARSHGSGVSGEVDGVGAGQVRSLSCFFESAQTTRNGICS